jgi:hypothetical protein
MYPRIFLTTLFVERIPQSDWDLAPADAIVDLTITSPRLSAQLSCVKLRESIATYQGFVGTRTGFHDANGRRIQLNANPLPRLTIVEYIESKRFKQAV